MLQPFDLDDLDDTPIPPMGDLTETRLRPRRAKIGPAILLLFIVAVSVGIALGLR